MDRLDIEVHDGRAIVRLAKLVGVGREQKMDDPDVEIVELSAQSICDLRHYKTGRREVNDGLSTFTVGTTHLFLPSLKKLSSMDGRDDRPSVVYHISEIMT